MKNISKALGGHQARPLKCVYRDSDTADGGKQGEITSDPKEVDAIVKRAWQNIFEGIGGCLTSAIDYFLDKYINIILKMPEADYKEIDADMVYNSFTKTKDSAGALDGWMPKELSLLSHEMCRHIATMLNQIEAGAAWPRSATHARVVYLEKLGAEVGKVMSYRPLTIIAPLYRAWATMRLRALEPWVRDWALHEMHAGIPEMGAVDAWIEMLTMTEELKLDGKDYCGGAADIAKFFDQVRRDLVYRIAEAAGMPRPILQAYRGYLENLLVYNCLAGGIGKPYKRRCGIPQGCPFSMAMVALIMRPWILLMRSIPDIRCFILADDVMIVATGRHMAARLVQALNSTHQYLHLMGAIVAPQRAITSLSKPGSETG